MHVSNRANSLILIAPAIALIICLIVFPVAQLMWHSIGDSENIFAFYERILLSPLYYQVILRTLVISILTALICAVLGYCIAYQLTRSGLLIKTIILVCIIVPFWTNILVRSYGWIIILSPLGPLNNMLVAAGLIDRPLELSGNIVGVLIGMTHVMLPYFILPLYSVMTKVEAQVMNAARSLGASPTRAFFKVYLPMTMPGVMAGFLLVFTMSLGYFVLPALLGGPSGLMLAQLIEFNINKSLNWGMASALSAVLLAATLLLFWTGDRWFKLGTIWGLGR